MKKFKLLKAHVTIPTENEVIIALFEGAKAILTRSPKTGPEHDYHDPYVHIHLTAKTEGGIDQFNMTCTAKVIKID